MSDRETILIVDDDVTFGDILQRALQRRGIQVDVARDSQQAFTLIGKRNYQKAIIDLKIGKESGLDITEELLRRKPHLHVVILTGYSSIATAVQAVKKGAANYLCKPADADEILAAFTETKKSPAAIPEQPPSIDRLAWEHIQSVLAAHDGNISATARALGMHRRTLQRKLSKRPVKH
ncbi:response regulator [Gilvimarinus sp. SDUM040013]|uniref:Response regulator n=1 Tax=Gilvimarinus gilvus TaxID=3058038 RepID=A0ABU4RSY2_9GAMM|nr:response regulator [Gilvimarinus sp. SDUM040013]MDO3388437.1 response regulator [Gilvimarinus sp. SDUM040013]MDX6847987.1 response regulator [Gilvimarinus sp. SDUM040013]